MSYPRDLEDYTANELWGELGRRSRLFNDGKCDYCGRVAGMVPACKYPQRHAAAASMARESDTDEGQTTADRIDDLRDALTDEDGVDVDA